jgi:Fe-S cluster biogenesis protein NfuA
VNRVGEGDDDRRGRVERRTRELSRLLTMHAGGVELDQFGDDGQVRVRFTGMCTGCPFRPVTMATTVRPALLALDGVTGVEAAGLRISEEAERRLADDLEAWWSRAAARRERSDR